jgi:hypothetical protein
MKRAQAAMEFLMTYGWAILVVLAAIGALAYFGVLSPGKLVPDKCQVGPGFDIKDCKVSTDSLVITLYNGLGVDIKDTNVSINSTGGSDVPCNTVTAIGDLPNGATSILTTVCDFSASPATVGQRFDGDISIIYTKSGEQLTHTVTGKIQRKVEQ